MSNDNKVIFKFPHLILGTLTAMIGYNIHNSIFWAILNWIFFPLTWIKWLICKDVNMTIIKDTFNFFLQ